LFRDKLLEFLGALVVQKNPGFGRQLFEVRVIHRVIEGVVDDLDLGRVGPLDGPQSAPLAEAEVHTLFDGRGIIFKFGKPLFGKYSEATELAGLELSHAFWRAYVDGVHVTAHAGHG